MGLPLVIIGQPGLALVGGAWLGIVAVGGGVMLLAAGLIFIRQAWLTFRN
jgi:glucose dehydrogenase